MRNHEAITRPIAEITEGREHAGVEGFRSLGSEQLQHFGGGQDPFGETGCVSHVVSSKSFVDFNPVLDSELTANKRRCLGGSSEGRARDPADSGGQCGRRCESLAPAKVGQW
jgi:hypothetical protein